MNFTLSSPNYPFIREATNSENIPDESCIIFAPNGSGKTTIYSILLENNPNDAIGFSYDSINPTYKKLEGKAKSILVDPTPATYVDIHNQCEALRQELSTAKVIGGIYGNKKKDLEAMPKFLRNEYNKPTIQSVSPLTEGQRANLKPLLDNPDDLKKALKNIDNLRKLASKDINNDAILLAHADISRAFSSLHLEEHKEEIEKEGCPFCGGHGESGNPYSDLMKRREAYSLEKLIAFKDYRFVENLFDTNILLEMLNSVLIGLNSLSDEQILTLLFTNGDEALEKDLPKRIDVLATKAQEEAALISEKHRKYEAMRSASSYVKSGFSEAYPGCSIELDDESETIKVITARAPNTYSEGEKHEMYAKIVQLSILGSSKQYLLVDDPLTELDAANEYKAVFRFVNLSVDEHKKVIIFTCNANLINLAAKQSGTVFKLFYLESSKVQGGSIETRLVKMDFGNLESGRPYLTLDKCISDSAPLQSDVCVKVANMVARRAQIDIIKRESRSVEQASLFAEASKVMHYDCSFTSQSFGVSNDDLFGFADGFTKPASPSFKEIVQIKLCLVSALRVYVEKMLYLYDQQRLTSGLGSVLTNDNLLTQKIKSVDEASDLPVKSFYPNWDRKLLMQMKTMLNDGDHPYGLVQPLFFAISITWDDYIIDIRRLKKLFSQEANSL